MASNVTSISGITLYNKTNGKSNSIGLGCRFKPSNPLTKNDQSFYHDKLINLVRHYKEIKEIQLGYVFLKENANEFIFYLNYGNFILFLSIMTTNVKDHFTSFSTVISTLLPLLEDSAEESKSVIVKIHDTLIPEKERFHCEECDARTCIPSIAEQTLGLKVITSNGDIAIREFF